MKTYIRHWQQDCSGPSLENLHGGGGSGKPPKSPLFIRVLLMIFGSHTKILSMDAMASLAHPSPPPSATGLGLFQFPAFLHRSQSKLPAVLRRKRTENSHPPSDK